MFKVLIVDDEPMAREAVKIAADWEDYGFIISGECENGDEALIAADKIRPDLIVTDIRMPDMDGLELIKKVFNNVDSDTSFILVSGYDDFDYAKRALQLGIRHYILKPVFREDLTELLVKVLQELEQREELKRIKKESTETELSLFFASLLEGSMDQKMIHANWPLDISYRMAEWTGAILDIPKRINDTNHEKENDLKTYDDLKIAFQRITSKDRLILTMLYGNGLYGIIFCCIKETATNFLMNEVKEILNELFPQGFYLSVGNPVRDVERLSVSMNEAEAALEYRFFSRPGSILFFRELENRSLCYQFGNMHSLDLLLNALESLDQASVLKYTQEMFRTFHEIYTAPEIVEMHIINIFYKSLSILRSMGGSFEGFPQSREIYRILDARLSLNELEIVLIEYIKSLLDYTTLLKTQDAHSNMKKVEEYIRNNFNRSLTIREIAGNLFIHPTYLGHLINKWFGCSFNEYLHKLRMEKAKQLLSDTDMKVHEIAVELGYGTYNNFLEQFYKSFSMKPTDYRNHIKK